MRLRVELLLGLVLLTSFAAGLKYRTTGAFYCHGKSAEVKIRVVEHDPNDDDIEEFTIYSLLDRKMADGDDFFDLDDPLELSIHATFDCHGCKGELYQYIDYSEFQYHEVDDSNANPMIMGAVELSNICKYGEAKSRYYPGDPESRRRKWLLRDDKVNLRDHWDYIN
uniref:Transthyretin/hydroxyisourate hydrolase domain-containing protein n=1 Tax=Panagrellus redivivus TaxID=6233 RepID=A0A7E4VXA8_PANRE